MNKTHSEEYQGKSAASFRPPLFRALGRHEPPAVIGINGRLFKRQQILKHDSWAATARYGDEEGELLACKFNRQYRLFILPMGWLGRLLGRRECKILRLMQHLDGFPRWAGPVTAEGKDCPNAVAHHWIHGTPFNPWTCVVDDRFFPRLWSMVEALHRQGIAYVDMSKWENILVGDDGKPYLIDYQIHFEWTGGWLLNWWLNWLQAADRYHLYRHWLRARPEQLPPEDRVLSKHRPSIVAFAEALGPPLRSLRRSVLQMAGIVNSRPALPVMSKPNGERSKQELHF
jgi:hypothetical protein